MRTKIKRTLIFLIVFSFCVTVFGMGLSVSANDVSTATVVEYDPSLISLDCSEAANILTEANWNFENGEYYWRLANTVDNQASAYYYVMTVTDEDAHEGESSLMLDGLGGWSNIMVPINVKKNTDYTFSMWVNASPGLGGMANTVWKIGAMEDYDPDAEIINVRAMYFTGDLGLGDYDGEWHQVGIQINSGDNDVLCFLIGDGGGLVFFDELRFFETDDPTGEAETGVANMHKVIAQVARENATPTPSIAPTTPPSSSEAQSSAVQSSADVSSEEETSESESAEESVVESQDEVSSQDESTEMSEETSVTESSVVSDNTSDDTTDDNNNTLVIVLILAGVVVLGGAAIWFFKFRKK